MREIITINVGETGWEIGKNLVSIYSQEHRIDHEGYFGK